MNTIEYVTQPDIRPEDVDFATLQRLRSIQAPYVFIGLGGGGSTAVSMLKTLFSNTFSAHIPKHQPDISPSFQFLAFDSDSSRPSNLERGREWIQLSAQGLGHGAWDEFRNNPAYSQWLASGVSYSEFATGCQGYRNLGKFLFHKNISDIDRAIKGAESRARSNPAAEKGGRITFVLFCTLAGGTGSGCLLDCAFLLRAMFPDFASMRIWSFLACAEGFSGNTDMDSRAKTGTYAALREIDYFMNPAHREEFIDGLEQSNDGRHGYLGTQKGASRGTFRFPGSAGIQGRYEKPFDWAFLLGHDNAEGVKLAQQSPKLSAMMARFAFSLCAYPVPEANGQMGQGQTFAANANNISDQLSMPNSRGANVCYMVPGLSAVHLPAAQVFDLMTIQSAQVMLRNLLLGSADKTNMDEAEAFVDGQRLTLENISAYIQEKLERIAGDSKNAVGIQAAQDVLKTGKRYTKKSAILRHISDYLEIGNFQNRIAERKKLLWKEELDPKLIAYDQEGKRDLQYSPYTIAESLNEFERSIIDQCNVELRTHNRRKMAVLDFLKDLSITIDSLLLEFKNRTNTSTLAHVGQCEQWESGKTDVTSSRGLLEDYVTEGGLIDALSDNLLKNKVVKDYPAICEAAFSSYRNRLRDELAASYVRELSVRVTAVRERLDSYFAACETASRTLARDEKALTRDLYEQEEGRGDQLETAFSFSLMSSAWRTAFREDHQLDDPSTIQDMIMETTKQDWRPLAVLDQHSSSRRNPSRRPLSDWIAQDLCDNIFAQLYPIQKTYSRWKDGEGIDNTLKIQLPGEGQGEGYKRAGLLLDQKCAPQWDVSQNATTLGQNVQSIKILAVPGIVTANIQQGASLDGSVNSLLTYEADRISMITFAYPIGLAGCGRVYHPLKAAYDQTIRVAQELDKARGNKESDGLRLYHCFPHSWEWPDPTELTSESDAYLPEFTTLLLLGRIHRFKSCPKEYRDLITRVRKAMDTEAKTPCDKAPGLFSPDGTSWYLVPFSRIDPEGNQELDFEAPIKLSKDLSAAFDLFSSTLEYREYGRQWTEWWEEYRTNWFGSEELTDILQKLSEWAQKTRDQREPSSKDYKIWEKVRRHFDATRRSLA